MTEPAKPQEEKLFGHPVGLYTLFFAEMWERFSYYGMRALLVLYMIKGFLSYQDAEAYKVYGAYTALVYMTPFFGGMIADRFLGARRCVILGGLGRVPPPGVAALQSKASSSTSPLRFRAAAALLRLGIDAAPSSQTLREGARSPSYDVPIMVLKAMLAIRDASDFGAPCSR